MAERTPDPEPAWRFLAGESGVEDFERWLYATPALEAIWGSEPYLALLSVDYRSRWAAHEVRKVLEPVIDFARFETWRLESMLRRILAGGSQGQAALAATYDECNDGYAFLADLAFPWGLNEHDALTGGTGPQDHWSLPSAAVPEVQRALERLRTTDVVRTW